MWVYVQLWGGLVVQGGVKGWSKIGLRRAEAVVRGYSVKEGILQNSWRDACVRASFLVGLRASGLRLCWGGGTLAQVFFVNFAKFFRTAFLTTHLRWLLLARGFI